MAISKAQAISNFNKALEVAINKALPLINTRLEDAIAGDPVNILYSEVGLFPVTSNAVYTSAVIEITQVYVREGWMVKSMENDAHSDGSFLFS